MRSKDYKIITLVIALLGIFGGVLTGVLPIFGDNTTVNIATMISVWLSTIVFCLIFLGIASVLQHLEKKEIGKTEKMERINPEEEIYKTIDI